MNHRSDMEDEQMPPRPPRSSAPARCSGAPYGNERGCDRHVMSYVRDKTWTFPRELMTILYSKWNFVSNLKDWVYAQLETYKAETGRSISGSEAECVLNLMCWIDRNSKSLIEAFLVHHNETSDKVQRFDDRVIKALNDIQSATGTLCCK